MPELPEVETIKLQLKQKILGKTIKNIEILSKKNFIGKSETVVNQKIVDISRCGKVIAIELSNNLYLNLHMKLTGQLLFAKNMKRPVFETDIPFTKTNKMPANTTRVIIYFTDGSGLFFNDLRKFGWIKVNNQPEQLKGIDVLSKDFSVKYLTAIVTSTTRPIKIILMDQDKIAGIGNIYANDALFLSKINPLRRSKTLATLEINNLYKAIKKVIEQGLKHGGSSGADEAYIRPDGKKGEHQRYFMVYQREGKPCPRCKTPIRRVKHGGRSSFYCPKCQK